MFAVCLGPSLAPVVAHAQTSAPLPLQGVLWQPPLSFETDALPHIEGTRLPGTWNWNAGATFQFLERPYAGHTTGSDGTISVLPWSCWAPYTR